MANPILSPKDFDSYGRLRQSLDAFRDAALVQYGQFQTAEERKIFSDNVSDVVDQFFTDFIKTDTNRRLWAIHEQPSEVKGLAQCPPGFAEVNGKCIRMGNPLMPKK
jgi:hypothetical protein